MKKIELEDLKVLETILRHARNETIDSYEAFHYIEDALVEIKRWKENGQD